MFDKKRALCVISALVFSASTQASSLPGVYFGGQLGWAASQQDSIVNPTINTNIDTLLTTPNHNYQAKSSNHGLAGRVFGGYQISQNLALELGYNQFKNSTASRSITTPITTTSASSTLKTYAIDLSAKGILPITQSVSVYGKVGAAYLNQTGSESGSIRTAGVTTFTENTNKNTSKILPTYGAGVSYDINEKLTTDVSWTRIQKVGNTSLNNTDFVGIGLAYHL